MLLYYSLSFALPKSPTVLVNPAISRLSAAHIKLQIASLVRGLGFVPPNVLALHFHRWTAAIKAIALAVIALDQVLDKQVDWAVS